MNNVTLIGRLTRDPEVRYTPDGLAIARFSVAIDRPAQTDKKNQTDFPNIVVFGKQAENCERFLKQGSRAGILGRIQTGKYTNKDGVTVYTTEVAANNVEFLDWNQDYRDTKKDVPKQKNDSETPEGFQAVEDDCPF